MQNLKMLANLSKFSYEAGQQWRLCSEAHNAEPPLSDTFRSNSRWLAMLVFYGTVLAAAEFLLPADVRAQEVGDSQIGLAFALAHCSECHNVKGTGNKSPNPSAPSFASVAKTTGMTGRALAVWLQTSHPTMPDFIISAEDRNNIIAYIMSLQPIPAQ